MRPTFRSLNKVLTLCGCERRLFISGLFVSFGLFAVFTSVLVGLATFGCFAALGYCKAKDPIMLRLIFNPGKFKALYDPARRKPFAVTVYDGSIYTR
ncbi:MAG TPA: hypothetical protein VEX68_00930 [Bryobacteraceae bacterium]|nr:hypothetical protein [Bryobacteraceae bacterium]